MSQLLRIIALGVLLLGSVAARADFVELRTSLLPTDSSQPAWGMRLHEAPAALSEAPNDNTLPALAGKLTDHPGLSAGAEEPYVWRRATTGRTRVSVLRDRWFSKHPHAFEPVSSPVQVPSNAVSVPVPGAAALGAIGLIAVAYLRRSR